MAITIQAAEYRGPLRDQFAELASASSSAAQIHLLRRWMRGRGLPPISKEEPHVVILEAIPAEDRYPYELLLAGAVQRVLELYAVDRGISEQLSPKELYNIFYLAAGISNPDLLNRPLVHLLNNPPSQLLDGEYAHLPLSLAFRVALTYNQINSSLWPLWRGILLDRDEGLYSVQLPGRAFDGLEGVRMMPPDGARGEPAWPILGEALGYYVQSIENFEDRRKKFKFVIGRILTTFAGNISSFELIRQADINQWAEWAVESLPELLGELSSEEKDVRRYFVWTPALIPMQEIVKTEVVERYCNSLVIVVKIRAEDNDRNRKYALKCAAVMDRGRYETDKAGRKMPMIRARHELVHFQQNKGNYAGYEALDSLVGFEKNMYFSQHAGQSVS